MGSIVVVAGIGNGSGTGAAAARLFASEGYTVALISRGADSLNALVQSIKSSGGQASAFPVSEYSDHEISSAFSAIEKQFSTPDYSIRAAIFNAAHGVWKPFLNVTLEDIRASNQINVESSFAFSRSAILAFQKNTPEASNGAKGTLIFTGATASLRGNVVTSVFSAGKFALRALSQSLAKEFGKQNIHVAHAIIDGGIATNNSREDRHTPPSGPVENPDPSSKLSPESIAKSYIYLVRQDQSSWTWELDLRPAHEKW
ncbi:unnamed protein product [Mycena citricolor]|uniref:NAD(P)-binding protein n=1 Tax=Mycena citricolor TaxID=2018698 RepID=A0AAD2HNP9_9AGAR|nr:unnamed protein product [Mycena citricolor]